MTESRYSAIIAALLLHLLAPTAHANEQQSTPEQQSQTVQINGIELPRLGNTVEEDLDLSREIPDAHVFQNAPEPAQTDSEVSLSDNKEELSVWELVRSSQPLPYQARAEIEAQREQYLTDAWWLNKTLARATPYLHFITSKLNERQLPLDLALIPAVESGYQPHASSSLSALGLWQIVPITAKEIGMKRTTWFDERGDIELSTRAALDYLSYLSVEFNGDWELTLAAYNAGPGRVKAAMRKNKAAQKPLDFWSLKLPSETQAYVPKILALAELIRQQPKSPLTLPVISTTDAFATVDAQTRISLDKAAELAGVSEAQMRNLNAGLIHAVTSPKGPHRLRVPIGAVEQFKRQLKVTKDVSTLYSLPLIHVVKAGDSISTIARNYGITQRRLKTLNKLSGNKILIGQKLAVVDKSHQGATSSDDGTTLSYTIRSGDTLSEIAERFNVKMADITFTSGAKAQDKVLIPGQKLKIQVQTDSNG